MSELFNVPEQLSPRLAWLKKYDVQVKQFPGHANEWSAWDGKQGFMGHGATEADAITAYAKERGIKLWNEEA